MRNYDEPASARTLVMRRATAPSAASRLARRLSDRRRYLVDVAMGCVFSLTFTGGYMSNGNPIANGNKHKRDKTGSASWAKGVSYRVITKLVRQFKEANTNDEINRLAHTLV